MSTKKLFLFISVFHNLFYTTTSNAISTFFQQNIHQTELKCWRFFHTQVEMARPCKKLKTAFLNGFEENFLKFINIYNNGDFYIENSNFYSIFHKFNLISKAFLFGGRAFSVRKCFSISRAFNLELSKALREEF